MPERDLPLQDLTIFLLNKDIKKPRQAISGSGLRPIAVHVGDQLIGNLYIHRAHSHVPRWAAFFTGAVAPTAFGRVASASAVLIVQALDRMFALTFGQGRHLLHVGCWEERFGLRVALNCLKENSLKSMDKHTFESIPRQSRVQVARQASARDFGLDIEQDLVSAVVGTPSDEQYGQRLGGADSLHASVRTDLEHLQELLARYFDKSRGTAYRKDFPWVDHLAEIKDPKRIAKLNNVLSKRLSKRDFDKCWLAAPVIVDWNLVKGFKYLIGRNPPVLYDLRLNDLFNVVDANQITSMEFLKDHRVCAVDQDGVTRETWSIYQCLNGEISEGDEMWLLNSGKWYRVRTNYVHEVDAAVAVLPRFAGELPAFGDESEQVYCKRVAGTVPGYFLMDRATIPIGGGYSKVEFCDLVSLTRDLIHVKRYGGSSVLGHLFAQSLVSGETFRSSPEFRAALNNRLPEPCRLADPRVSPNASDYQIVLAIVKESEALRLPFFARVMLRQASRRLQAFGYRVALASIGVNEIVAKRRRYN